MKSNLDVNKLGQIWVLSDIDQDGMLNEHEFTVAMHLTYKALAGTPLPDQLPLELQTRKFYSKISFLLERILMEHIDMKNSAESKLQVGPKYSIRTRSRS